LRTLRGPCGFSDPRPKTKIRDTAKNRILEVACLLISSALHFPPSQSGRNLTMPHVRLVAIPRQPARLLPLYRGEGSTDLHANNSSDLNYMS
jgi:hypothetical protein